uniref:Glutaredoxin domain-containing protein n=1 Tax=Pavo cristatus TaxID=9049 RepID=A0A8C9G059_PAVCR
MSGSLRAALRLGAWVARGRPGRRQLSEVASSSAGGSGGADGGGGSGSREAVERLVREHPVVVFMKGSPAQPLCGFSNAVVQILRLHGVEDYRAHDVLQDPDLRQGHAVDAPCLEVFQGQVGWGPGQPELVGGDSNHRRQGTERAYGPSQPKPFYGYQMLSFHCEPCCETS